MDRSASAVALVARSHARDGSQLSGPETKDRLRSAAATLGQERPGILAGPSTVTQEGELLLTLAAPHAILEAVLRVASALRPTKTTFSAAIAPLVAPEQAVAEPAVDATLLAAESAARTATEGIRETDPRECRVTVAAPKDDRVIGVLIDLILEGYDSMTDRQRQIVRLVRSSDTQQEVATHLDISRQAVNQSLAASGWLHLKCAEEAAAAHLVELAAPVAAVVTQSKEPATV